MRDLSLAVCLAGTSWAAAASEFDCVIEARRMVTISGPIEALIANIKVDRGDVVRKGDVLVEFDAGVEKATADLAKFRAEMLGTIEARQARVDFTSIKHERRVELAKQNYTSRQDLDEALAERRLSEAELREAKDNKRVAELDYRRASEVQRQRSLLSPINGVVVERLMHPGEVSELGRKPILKLAEVGTLNVEVILPTEAYRQVAKGDVVVVRPQSPVGGEFKARVSVVDSVLDAASGTFGVRLELPNEERKLPAGLRCRADFAKVTTTRAAQRPLPPPAEPAAVVRHMKDR
jgi:RND family efflux transporter MFP subunit